ncbi:MAG: DUF5320 domain-containing protein [Deltaproteobacteria bacterium]|nr:DUF5320 domain-containing protein [Deltaproteobacteria bacterium]
MPRFDGTGPEGKGPMTGWGQGRCIIAKGPGGWPKSRWAGGCWLRTGDVVPCGRWGGGQERAHGRHRHFAPATDGSPLTEEVETLREAVERLSEWLGCASAYRMGGPSARSVT